MKRVSPPDGVLERSIFMALVDKPRHLVMMCQFDVARVYRDQLRGHRRGLDAVDIHSGNDVGVAQAATAAL